MKILELAEATVSSLRACRASKTVVKCKFSRLPTQPSRHFVLVGRSKRTVLQCKFSVSSRNPFVLLRSSDVQNCDEMQIFRRRHNPFVTSCWSDVRNCGKLVIFVCCGLPRTSRVGFIHFCARRCRETCILKFWVARRCSETHILILLDGTPS